jgi:hypothetical protein
MIASKALTHISAGDTTESEAFFAYSSSSFPVINTRDGSVLDRDTSYTDWRFHDFPQYFLEHAGIIPSFFLHPFQIHLLPIIFLFATVRA